MNNILGITTGEGAWELLIAFVTVSGPILLLLVRQHYKLRSIDSALNKVEVDMVDTEGAPPSIREKINSLSLQVENSINKALEQLQNDRTLDRIENTQQRQLIFSAINDLREDIIEIRTDLDENTRTGIEETLRNRESMEKTRQLLILHMEEEEGLLQQYLNNEITSDEFIEKFHFFHRNNKENPEK